MRSGRSHELPAVMALMGVLTGLILQANINYSVGAHDLLSQITAEWNIELTTVAETYLIADDLY